MGCIAQVTGSDTVCAGYIYTYNANIPGAVSYTWTVPANWYGLTGQGTSQINVTCNAGAGQVCAEGFDSIGTSLGTQCLVTDLGGAGSTGWQLQPSGFNDQCDGVSSVTISPTIIPFGGGGGGCVSGCGSGTQHPNLVWGLFLGPTFQGLIGTTFSVGLGSYYAAYVDTTLGKNFPQAIEIEDGCGGAVSNSLSIGHIQLVAIVNQVPFPACVGDTVLLQGNGTQGTMGGPYWTINSGLTAITSENNFSQLQVVVTGTPASIGYLIEYTISSGISMGSLCTAFTSYNVSANICATSAAFQTATTVICESSCVNFTNTSQFAITYQWSFPGATPDTSTDVNPVNICYNSPGSYDVMLIASNAGQTDTLLMPGYITVTPTPEAGFTATDTSFCEPGCTGFANSSLNATGYQWNFPGAIPATSTNTDPQGICYNSSGTFDVTLISSNSGCSDTLILPNYINVNVSPQTAMGANPVSFCPGSCTDFTNYSINATSYQWSFAGATIDTSTLENPNDICYNIPGQYGVQLISSNGICTDTLIVSNYITVFPQPFALSIFIVDDTLIADQGFASYQWFFNGNIIPAATDYYYIATANGDYNVVATDSNGCEVEAAIFNVMVMVETSFSEDRITIAPNPFNNKLSFHPLHSSAEKCSIIVLNSIGEKFFEKQTTFIDQEIDLSLLDTGFYMLLVQTNTGISFKKIVKM